jgi:hypothetical protein
MFRTFLSLVLIALLSQSLNAAPLAAAAVKPQGNADAQTVEKIRLKVAKIGIGDKAKITVRIKDGRKIKGFITQAGANDFTVRDRQTGDPTLIVYSDVNKVEDNRGHSSLRNILIGVGVGAGALLAVLAIIFVSLED